MEYLIGMWIILWASVRSMVRLSVGGYDRIYGYDSLLEAALPPGGDLNAPRTIPARL